MSVSLHSSRLSFRISEQSSTCVALVPLTSKLISILRPAERPHPVLHVILPLAVIVRPILIEEFSLSLPHVLNKLTLIMTPVNIPLLAFASAVAIDPRPDIVVTRRPCILPLVTVLDLIVEASLINSTCRPFHLAFDFLVI